MSTRVTRSSVNPQPQSLSTSIIQAATAIAKRPRAPSQKLLKDGEAEQILHHSPPSTPPSKKAKKTTTGTPTPSLIGAFSNLHSTGDIDDALPTDRPAEPHVTNAPLKTPGGTRLTAYTAATVDASPSKTGRPRPTTTTGQLLDDACAHLLKVEPRLKDVIEKHHCRVFAPEGLAEEIDPFRSLVSGIMAQQVSGAAASSIKKKFIGLFLDAAAAPSSSVVGPAGPEQNTANLNAGAFPTPAQVAAKEVAFLRQAGLSGRKAEYIKGLAEKFTSGELSAQMLIEGSYEEVVEKLVAVRGLGLWSVEMFACFGLKRMDVFSTGDLGVQRGMAAFWGKDVKKLKAKGGGKWKYMSEADMLGYSEKFAPYRSLFMWYMWRVEDVNVAAIQNS
ncbi:3-methyladenine DNA glycosylase [Ptychographa xylographoides]|nr:3-methyladenine DNA glycosylase [Ptychographa xylographoides]